MITEATYRRDGRTVSVRVERIDTWVEDAGEIVNFPCLLELDGRLILFYSRSRHGGEHVAAEDPVNVIESCDDGDTWHPAPDDFELLSRDPVSGRISDTFSTSLGYLRDGTIVHIGHNTQLQHDVGYDRSESHMHVQFQQDDPTFRFQRASRDGRLLETVPFKVSGMTWGRASYQVYSTILELPGGDLLAAMEWAKILPESEWIRRPNGTVWVYRFGVFHRAVERRRQVMGAGGRVRPGEDRAGVRGQRPRRGRGVRRGGSARPAERRHPVRDAHGIGLPAVAVTLARRRAHLGRAGADRLAGGEAAAAGAAERRPGLRVRARLLRPAAGHPRDAQPGRHRPPLGAAVLLPYRPRLLVHLDHAARRQAARDLLGLRLHPRHRHPRPAKAGDQARGALHRGGVNRDGATGFTARAGAVIAHRYGQ